MRVEIADLPEHGRIIGWRRCNLSSDPAENIAVRRFHQQFIIIKLSLAENGNLGVNEAAHDKIHLPHAPMPGAEEDASTARIEEGIRA